LASRLAAPAATALAAAWAVHLLLMALTALVSEACDCAAMAAACCCEFTAAAWAAALAAPAAVQRGGPANAGPAPAYSASALELARRDNRRAVRHIRGDAIRRAAMDTPCDSCALGASRSRNTSQSREAS